MKTRAEMLLLALAGASEVVGQTAFVVDSPVGAVDTSPGNTSRAALASPVPPRTAR